QSRTVVEVAQANPGLLTCQDLDLMWRLAAAFAQTGRADRASDAYRQSRTVVEVAQANPGLLTCQDLDLMWRLAAAFA
ncbi:hypothetical protein CNY89_29430, partial [Amaricoccus sp. HAR-UPW-R2A-40]